MEGERKLTPDEIISITATAPSDALVTVFCIDGVIVEIPFREALERLPFDVMMMEKHMFDIITAQGEEALFLSPMSSDMLLDAINEVEKPDSPWEVNALTTKRARPTGRVLTNINKACVNAVASSFGEQPVFGLNEDGILRHPKR